MVSPLPIDPSNVQWAIHHQSTRIAPQCATTGMSPASIVTNSGDYVVALNRCLCFPSTGNSTGSCQYFSLVTANNTIETVDCEQDTNCLTNCKVLAQYSTLTNSPCTTDLFTGPYSIFDYTTTTLWDPGFKTNYFYYYAFATNDPSCTTISQANRVPVYPNCTQILPGVSAITLLNPISGNVERYACTDPACNSCQIVSSTTPNTLCGVDSADSGTYFSEYRKGAIMSDPSLVLPSHFPNQSAPAVSATAAAPGPSSSTSTSTPPSDSSNAILIGGVVGGIAVIAIAAGAFILWYHRRSKRLQQQDAPVLPSLPSAATQATASSNDSVSISASTQPPSHFVPDTLAPVPVPGAVPVSGPGFVPPGPGFVPPGPGPVPGSNDPYAHQYRASQMSNLGPAAPYPPGMSSSPRASYLGDPAYSGSPQSFQAPPYTTNDRHGNRGSFQPPVHPSQLPSYRASMMSQPSNTPVVVDEKFQIASFQRGNAEPEYIAYTNAAAGGSRTSSGYSSQGSLSSKYVAVVEIPKVRPTDLALTVGDVVILQRGFQNGFAQAFNQTTGMSGVIPEHSVRPLGPERYLPSQ
ncbi:uncharacterized protein BJ171DRAFT_55769 [Polychytrium aggregatum]|uniref:uncharacterized protein n=1 Tax=Polychytrium aggregatum TaxID=110093 RepID=UPI0022FDCEEE|nr:uncharacterized protein BJ171DRAFT_55769 [Polychytrium aggregatum]KAI9205970.1 hypothetical protein BJ171DRAFT_55769 [Polychytrium aggregatum]